MTTVLDALNSCLHQCLQHSSDVYLLGEDILDPYGGAFKVAKGLSSDFPDRVITTPVSEAGIVGLGVGMALRGLRPVIEIMFGDFLTLAADQLINHAAKFRWMSDDQVRVPVVVVQRGLYPTQF
jgi:pyruvate/2-oxoglutarate/acetoin dehydrogenase E1 component